MFNNKLSTNKYDKHNFSLVKHAFYFLVDLCFILGLVDNNHLSCCFPPIKFSKFSFHRNDNKYERISHFFFFFFFLCRCRCHHHLLLFPLRFVLRLFPEFACVCVCVCIIVKPVVLRIVSYIQTFISLSGQKGIRQCLCANRFPFSLVSSRPE
jgi:hypothetical protein